MAHTERHPLQIWVEDQLNFYGGTTLLIRDCLREGFKKPYYWGLLSEQIYQIGVKSFPLVFADGQPLETHLRSQAQGGVEDCCAGLLALHQQSMRDRQFEKGAVGGMGHGQE